MSKSSKHFMYANSIKHTTITLEYTSYFVIQTAHYDIQNLANYLRSWTVIITLIDYSYHYILYMYIIM